MTLITSSEWVAEARERKKKRDEARNRFIASIGVKPVKNLQELSFAPADQIAKIQKLSGAANKLGDKDVDTMLKTMAMAMLGVGLGAGGIMSSMGATKLNTEDFVTNMLSDFFTEE